MHIPVLLKETLSALAPRAGGVYLDCTLGGGGHAEAILEASAPDGKLLGLDRDAQAIERCRERLGRFGARFTAVHAPFAELTDALSRAGFPPPDGILLDLGVSSFQLDEADRGFSFRLDGPLDMRMDRTRGVTAAELLDSFAGDAPGLARLLRDFGEEPQAMRVARAIVAARAKGPIDRTAQLANIVEKALGGRRGAARHPATRTFQALRIAVNDEFGQLRAALESAFAGLAPDGVLAVISFHSLEDRIVKQTMRAHEAREVALPQGGTAIEGALPRVARILRRAVAPSEDECLDNPRARSAKLRAVRRLPETVAA